MKNETTYANEIEMLRAAKAAEESAARASSLEDEKNTPGTIGERNRKLLKIALLEARSAHAVARAKVRASADANDEKSGKVDTPSTLLAKVHERLARRKQLAGAIDALDTDLVSTLEDSSRALANERIAAGLPTPAVHVLIGKVSFPSASAVATSARARASLPVLFAELVKVLEDAIATAPPVPFAEEVRKERGILRRIEVAIATEEAERAEAQEAHERAVKAEEKRTADRNESERQQAKARRERQEAEIAYEDELISRLDRGFGGAA